MRSRSHRSLFGCGASWYKAKKRETRESQSYGQEYPRIYNNAIEILECLRLVNRKNSLGNFFISKYAVFQGRSVLERKKRVLVIQMEKGPQVDEEGSSGVWLEISWMSLPARS